MFKQIKITKIIYEMAEEIAKKKRKKIENLIEDYIKEEWKRL